MTIVLRRVALPIGAAGLLIAACLSVARLAHPTKARAQSGCSAATIQGSFGYAYRGVAAGFPVAGVGRVTLDGSGNATGSETLSANGVPLQRTFTGTYAVKDDCTGTGTYQDSLGQTFHESGVITNGGNQIVVVVTDPGVVLSFEETRQ